VEELEVSKSSICDLSNMNLVNQTQNAGDIENYNTEIGNFKTSERLDDNLLLVEELNYDDCGITQNLGKKIKKKEV
jgi:hypothetical protein